MPIRTRTPGVPGLDCETWGTTDAAVGFVLAGGQSLRMGREKALVEFGGRPLVAHAVDVLAAAGVPVWIAGAQGEARTSLEAFAPVIPDAEPGLGPLGGICSALGSAAGELSVFLPVDVPLMPPSLIVYLLRRALITESAVTLASVNSFPQTFPAVISRRALPVLRRELESGRRGCLASFRAAAGEMGERLAVVGAEVLAQSGQVSHPRALPAARWFLNVNAEKDLRVASLLRTSRVS